MSVNAEMKSAIHDKPWTAEEFKQQLFAKEAAYHIHHPFNIRMNRGELTPEQIRCWVANRFYYQINIPQKDGAILSNCPDRETRRQWILRIHDHDGQGDDAGGIEAWVHLAEAVGIARKDLWSLKQVAPGVRFAVDAYVNFARKSSWQEGVCSSLTEIFAPKIHKERLANWPTLYPWIEPSGLRYFRSRISLAERDVLHGLQVTLAHFTTVAQQKRALEILQFKLDVLWSMMDAIELACSDRQK